MFYLLRGFIFFWAVLNLALAQTSPLMTQTSSDIADILTRPELQTSVEVAKQTSQLEDQMSSPTCNMPKEDDPSCQGFANSLLPKNYKEKGWKTLFEIKYQPIEARQPRSTSEANFRELGGTLRYYRNLNSDPITELKTADDLKNESAKISAWYESTYGRKQDPFNIQVSLMLEQINNPSFYPQSSSEKENNDLMFSRIKEYSKNMNDADYLRFVSAMAGFVDYNWDRASFQQTQEGGHGVVTPFDQLSNTKAGICGDIHSMAAKLGEIRGWETFTTGYALEGMQHVLTSMVDPKHPDKLMVVNYGTYEEQSLNDGNSVVPTPTGQGADWSDIGMQMRIFKNDKTGDPTGKMQQIATVPTALGSFMSDLFKKEYEVAKAMPENMNFRKEEARSEYDKRSVTLKNNDQKIVDKLTAEGIVVYEGETENARIYGVGVSLDVYKDLYRWDEKENKCVLKKNKYFSLGVASSLVNFTPNGFQDTFYVYLNMKGGQIFHIYQSEHFQFKGLIGYELSGFGAVYDQEFLSADGNFKTLMGVVADYQKKGTTVHTALTYEANLGLRDQNLMTDFSSLPTNLNPMTFNAVNLSTSLTQKVGENTSLVSDTSFSMTRVGSRITLSSGIIHKNTSLMLSYQGGVKPFNIGNTLQSVNLLQNFNNMDGVRLTASQGFSNKKGTVSGSVSAYGGISTSTAMPTPMAGGTLRINLKGKKKRTSNP